MAEVPKDEQERHSEARDLAEEALAEYAKGNQKKGDDLAEKAASIDRSAVEEVVRDIDEDAGSNHQPAQG